MMSLGIDSGKFVSTTVVPTSISLASGGARVLNVKFKTVDAVHVNLGPPLVVESLMKGVSFVVKSFGKSGSYLDTAKPVEIECRAKNISAGVHKVGLTFGYTYCSDKEEWCRMANDTLAVEINIKK